MICSLKDSTESITMTLGGSNAHDYSTSSTLYAPGGRTSEGTPTDLSGSITDTTVTTVVSAPVSGTKNWETIFVRNTTGNTTTTTLKKKVGSTSYTLFPAISLASGESFGIGPDGKLTMYQSTGLVRTS